MLALAILMLVGEFILNILIGVNAALNNNGATWVVAFLAIACLAFSIVALVKGIRGIRDPLIRGKSIATTIISGAAVTYGFALMLIAFTVAAGLFVINSSGDFTFTYLALPRF